MKEKFNMNNIFTILSPSHNLTTKQNYADTVIEIERHLVDTYKKEPYAQRKWNLYEERRSLIVASLYNQILKFKKLPTVEEFVERYIEEFRLLIVSK